MEQTSESSAGTMFLPCAAGGGVGGVRVMGPSTLFSLSLSFLF